MKNRNRLSRLGGFVLGKGFYIVLSLCAVAIGISGYFLIRAAAPGGNTQPAGGGAQVTVPQPVNTLPQRPALPEPERETALSAQPEDPEPVKQPEPEAPRAVVYTWPVKGEVLRCFDLDTLAPDPTMGDWRTHGGLDISAAADTKVLAMAAGVVTEVKHDGLMGVTVVIDHQNGVTSTCCGLADPAAVSLGQKVDTGTVIGAVGSTAIAESALPAHIHLETTKDGAAADPLEFLPQS